MLLANRIEADIIEIMRSVRTWPPMKPIDWLVVSVRWVWLSVLPIIAGLAGAMSPSLAYTLIGWTFLSFLATLADATGWRPPLLQAAVVVADLGFALAAVAFTGMLTSPLWWALLIAAVSIGLRFGTKAVLLVSAVGGVAAVIMILVITTSTPLVLVPLSLQALSVVLAGGILGWLASLVRTRAISMEHRQAQELDKLRELERERTRAIFRMAAALNATLWRWTWAQRLCREAIAMMNNRLALCCCSRKGICAWLRRDASRMQIGAFLSPVKKA